MADGRRLNRLTAHICTKRRRQRGGSSQPLWRISTSGGQPVKVLDSVYNAAFALHELGIYYAEQAADEIRIQFYNLRSRESASVVRNIPSGGLTASPDSRTILYAKRDAAVADLMLVDNFR
jgi:hypothetical protein